MLDLTVDVGVLMSGFDLGDPIHSIVSQGLIHSIETNDPECVQVVMDDEDCIEHSYVSKLGDVGRKWIQLLGSQNKIKYVKRARVPRNIAAQLRDLHLDPEDYKYYVRTSASSYSGLLVSHDPHYSPKIKQVLSKGLNVHVVAADDAQSRVDAECLEPLLEAEVAGGS